MQNLNEDIDHFIERQLAAAYRARPDIWNRPILPRSIICRGSFSGFSDAEAQAILMDSDCQVALDNLWTTYASTTGSEFPPLMEDVLEKERAREGPRWNVQVAHAVGRWGDDEFNAEVEQWLAVHPYTEDVRIPVAARGYKGHEVTADESGKHDATTWESYFHTQHFLVLLRRLNGSLVGQIESASVTGQFTLHLEWPESECREVQVKVVRTQRRPTAFSIGDAPHQMPIKASIRASDAEF